MFEQAEAVRYDRMMSKGRTCPLLLECELADGSTVEVIAKFSKGCSVGGLVREALVAMLASDLGLPVPAPFLVSVSPALIDTIPDTKVADLLRNSDALGFGSRRLPDGYSQWTEPEGQMSDQLEQEATDVIAFDSWLVNSDRRATNPNLLTNGKQFAIFDHELALLGPSILFWKEPWLENALMHANPPKEHVFYQHLRGRAQYLTDPLIGRITAISDARIAAYVSALPQSWIQGENTAAVAQNYIMALRDNLANADLELKKALA